MLCLRNPSLKTSLRVASQQIPAVSEVFNPKRNSSSYEHFLKFGHGGRNSFNGIVATVFGASGFLGKYVVNRLARSGTQIIIPYRGIEDDVKHLRLMGDLGQIVFVNYDLRDEESIAKTLTHSNVAVNLIGRNFPTRNFSMDDCLVKGAATIAKLAASNNVDRFIHVSALNAKADSPSKFLQAKAFSERVVTENFRDTTIVRPAEVYGDEDEFLNKYAYMRRTSKLGVPLVDGGRSTLRRPVFAPDVAQGIVNTVKDNTTKGKVYELYGPEEYYLRDIVEFVSRLIRKSDKIISVPAAAYQLVGLLGEFSIFHPRITRDLATRQFLSDEPSPDAYTFEDLGIAPQNINDTGLSILRRHRVYYNFDQMLDEAHDVCKPANAE